MSRPGRRARVPASASRCMLAAGEGVRRAIARRTGTRPPPGPRPPALQIDSVGTHRFSSPKATSSPARPMTICDSGSWKRRPGPVPGGARVEAVHQERALDRRRHPDRPARRGRPAASTCRPRTARAAGRARRARSRGRPRAAPRHGVRRGAGPSRGPRSAPARRLAQPRRHCRRWASHLALLAARPRSRPAPRWPRAREAGATSQCRRRGRR